MVRYELISGRWMAWWCGGLVAAAGIGWLSASLHEAGFAPIGVFSLAVGLGLGAVLAGLAGRLSLSGPRLLVTGTVALALLTAVAEHAWLYSNFRRQWYEARASSPEVAMFRPESPWSPGEYFARELTARRAALWGADAALITVGAIGAVVLLRRERERVRPDGRV